MRLELLASFFFLFVLLASFFKWKNWHPKNLRNLSALIQLVFADGKFEPSTPYPHSSCSFYCAILLQRAPSCLHGPNEHLEHSSILSRYTLVSMKGLCRSCDKSGLPGLLQGQLNAKLWGLGENLRIFLKLHIWRWTVVKAENIRPAASKKRAPPSL